MNVDLIKKLELKKGKKYILFVPKSAGIPKAELEKLDYKIIALAILTESNADVKIIEFKE